MPSDLSPLGLCEEYAENCECGLEEAETCKDCHQNEQNCECAVVRGPTYTRVLTYSEIENINNLDLWWALKWEAYNRLDGPLAGYYVHCDREKYTITFYTERGKPSTSDYTS